MIRCSTCSTENVDGARFCASCGSPLGEACSNWEAARVDLSLAEAEAAMGQRESATVRLRSALELFDKLGSVRERDRATDLLDSLA